MASCLGPISTSGHVAPAASSGPRRVIEDPAAALVVADPDPLRIAGRELRDERVRKTGQRIVDRVADVPMIHRHAAVGCGNELDDLTGVERAIDRIQGTSLWRPVISQGVGHFPECPADGPDPGEIPGGGMWVDRRLVSDPVRAFAMDDAAAHEPGEGIVEAGNAVDRETILQVVRVQEVEGVVQSDVVSVAPGERSVDIR